MENGWIGWLAANKRLVTNSLFLSLLHLWLNLFYAGQPKKKNKERLSLLLSWSPLLLLKIPYVSQGCIGLDEWITLINRNFMH